MKSLQKFIKIHENSDDSLRLGQRFVNFYIQISWPELFYAEDKKSVDLIEKWLYNHQYINELPVKIKRLGGSLENKYKN